jgi:hypothetical protein
MLLCKDILFRGLYATTSLITANLLAMVLLVAQHLLGIASSIDLYLVASSLEVPALM